MGEWGREKEEKEVGPGSTDEQLTGVSYWAPSPQKSLRGHAVHASEQPGLRTLGCPSLVEGSGGRNSLAPPSCPTGEDTPAVGTRRVGHLSLFFSLSTTTNPGHSA